MHGPESLAFSQSRMQCVEKNITWFPLAVCKKLKISSNCHSVNFPTFQNCQCVKKMLAAKCQIAIMSMCLIYNAHWQFVKSYALLKKITNQKKSAKTGKESKDELEDRRKKEEQSKKHFYFFVDCPNIDVLSLIWSPACFSWKEIQLWEKLLTEIWKVKTSTTPSITCRTTLWRKGSSSLSPRSTSATD